MGNSDVSIIATNESLEDERRLNVELAEKFATFLSQGTRPMNTWSFIVETLEDLRDRGDLSFNDPAYARAVLPVMMERDPGLYDVLTAMLAAGEKAAARDRRLTTTAGSLGRSVAR